MFKSKLTSFLAIVFIIVTITACTPENNNNNDLIPDTNVSEKSEDFMVYYFYGDGCPACSRLEPYIDDFIDEYEKFNVTIHKFEVWFNPEHREKMNQVQEIVGNIQAVPATVVGKEIVIGANHEKIKNLIEKCIEQECEHIILE